MAHVGQSIHCYMYKMLIVRFVGFASFFIPAFASAHSFGQNFSLPIPVWLYFYTGGAVIVVSFLVLTLFELQQSAVMKKYITSTIEFNVPLFFEKLILRLLQVVVATLLVTALIATVYGKMSPSENFAPLLIWIIFYLGLPYFTLIFGNIWIFIDPIKKVLSALPKKSLFEFPVSLRYVPAYIGYLLFIWLELLSNGFASEPEHLLVILVCYAMYTCVGVLLFGVRSWYLYADIFSVLFTLIGMASPLQYAKHRMLIRIPFSRLTQHPINEFPLMLFVLLMLSATTFDGFRETTLWGACYRFLLSYTQFAGESVGVVISSITLFLSPLIFFGLFYLAIVLMKRMTHTAYDSLFLCSRFIPTLIPIAIGYQIAHYFSLLLIQTQAFAIVSSDPFNVGWNIFGTADMVPNIGIIGIASIWRIEVAVIIFVHVVSVMLSHVIAIQLFPVKRLSIIGQIPLLVVMVVYTLFGLWVLSLPLKVG